MSTVISSQQVRSIIAENLVEALAVRGWKQVDLAKRMFNTSKPTTAEKMKVSRWCSGSTIPDAAELSNLAEVLATSMDRLCQKKS